MRVVIDTAIIASAFRSRLGASNQVLLRVARGLLVPLATPALFLEYEEVLKRPEQRAASDLSLASVDAALAALAAAIEPVEIRFGWRPQLDDSDDEMVLEAAINGRAEAIITFNRRDFRRAAPRFGIDVLTPGEYLRRI